MESYPNSMLCPFSNHDPPQLGSAYDSLYDGGIPECWGFEDFRYKAGLNVNHFQSSLVFESENSIAPPSYTTDFASSQLRYYTTFGYAGNNHAISNLVPNEATEAHSERPTSTANAGYTDFCQEINNGIISPSVTFQPLCIEHVKPPVYALEQDFEPLSGGESGENPLNCNSLGEIPSQQTNRTTFSRLRSLSKPKPQATKFYCNIHPCNHQKTFTRKADLDRHRATQHIPLHSPEKKLSQCPWPDCKRKGANRFPRRDKMLQHQDKVHGRRLVLELQLQGTANIMAGDD